MRKFLFIGLMLLVSAQANAEFFMIPQGECKTCVNTSSFGVFGAGSLNSTWILATIGPFDTMDVTNPVTGQSARVFVDLTPWSMALMTVFGVTFVSMGMPDGTVEMTVTLRDENGNIVSVVTYSLNTADVIYGYNALVAANAEFTANQALADEMAAIEAWLDAGGDPEQSAMTHLGDYYGDDYYFVPYAPPSAPNCTYQPNIPESEVLGFEVDSVVCY